jgi:hypothetical protein
MEQDIEQAASRELPGKCDEQQLFDYDEGEWEMEFVPP